MFKNIFIPGNEPTQSLWQLIGLLILFVPINVLAVIGKITIHPYVVMIAFLIAVLVWAVRKPLWVIYGPIKQTENS